MHLPSKHHETIAVWIVAALLMVVIGLVPWQKLGTNQPPGVVDVTQRRFSVDRSGSYEDGAEIYDGFDSEFTFPMPDGL